MKRSKFSDGQILAIVKGGEAGRKVSDLRRANGITEQTYYRRKAKYGRMELRLGGLLRYYYRARNVPFLRRPGDHAARS